MHSFSFQIEQKTPRVTIMQESFIIYPASHSLISSIRHLNNQLAILRFLLRVKEAIIPKRNILYWFFEVCSIAYTLHTSPCPLGLCILLFEKEAKSIHLVNITEIIRPIASSFQIEEYTILRDKGKYVKCRRYCILRKTSIKCFFLG